ncbi:ABC transporter substrate-binding protein, partial [Rhodoplanes roseus]|uniref:ABC transporter substrate-binding protein n=1 Tax=Rhodoplanes roseus TaxID=29409 RepID=UPI001FE1DC6C
LVGAAEEERLATQPAGSVPNTTLQHWLWEVGKVDKADVTVVPMGIDATQQAVLVGAVEGATVREPAVTIVQGRDPSIKLVALGGEMFPGQPGTVVAATGAFLDKSPAQAQGLVDAVVRATRLIQQDPARVAPHIESALGKGITDVATIRKALASPASKFVADPRAIVDATAAMQRYQVKLGSLDKELSLDGLFDPTYFVKAAASQ